MYRCMQIILYMSLHMSSPMPDSYRTHEWVIAHKWYTNSPSCNNTFSHKSHCNLHTSCSENTTTQSITRWNMHCSRTHHGGHILLDTCTFICTHAHYSTHTLAPTHCSTLQHTATHCNILQSTATHTAVRFNMSDEPRVEIRQFIEISQKSVYCTIGYVLQLEDTATCILKADFREIPLRSHTVTHCTTLQHTAPHCNTLQHTATCILKADFREIPLGFHTSSTAPRTSTAVRVPTKNK